MRWGWVCNAQWIGRDKIFTITIPTNGKHLAVLGARYSAPFNQIEIWGMETNFPNKNHHHLYNDFGCSQSPFSIGRRQSNGGADGEAQPSQSKAVDEQPPRERDETGR